MKNSKCSKLVLGDRHKSSIVWITGLLVLLISMTALSAQGADIGLDSFSDNYNNGWADNFLTWAHTIGTGQNRMLVVAVTTKDFQAAFRPLISVTYAGAPLTKYVERHGYNLSVEIYYMLDSSLPASGTHSVAVQSTGPVAAFSGWSMSLYNVSQAPPEAATLYAGSFCYNLNSNITTQTNGAWVIDNFAIETPDSSVWSTSGNSQWYEVKAPPLTGSPNGHTVGASVKPVTTAGMTTMGWGFNDCTQLVSASIAIAPADVYSTYHNIVASVGTGEGTVQPATQTVTTGENASITITPESEWSIASIVDNGTTVPVANPYIIADVHHDHNIVVNFTAPDTYLVSAAVGGGNGTVSPSLQTVNKGESASITISAAAGYEIESIVDNGSAMSPAGSYTIQSVQSDHDIVVTFAETEPEAEGDGCFEISDTPLDVRLHPAPPMIMFVLDDSGSMDWETITSESSGTYNGGGYLFDNPGDNVYGTSYYATEEDRKGWKSQFSGYNKLWFNPKDDYPPWPGMTAADTTAPRSNPVNAEPVYTLSASFIKLVGDTDEIIINRAHYYTFVDIQGDGSYDGYEPVILVNFVDENNDGKLDSREYYKLSDPSNPNVSVGGLMSIPESLAGQILSPRPFEEELQNFANWFSYYRKRYLTANASVATVITQAQGMRIGFVGINKTVNQPLLDVKVDGVDHTEDLLHALYYAPRKSGSTPLRAGLISVGQYFDQDDGGLDGGIGESPYTSENDGGGCQQAYAILMTDGYYNGTDPTLGNVDQSYDEPFSDTYSNTLADVAMHYYNRDLSPNLPDNVPTNDRDEATYQHLVTYGVGFGVTGTLDPKNYDIPGGVYPQWPNPKDGNSQKVDDLWHASVNGRGQFVTASNAQELAYELLSFIKEIQMFNLSGASVSVNGDELYTKLNDDVMMFQSKYYSETWSGDVLAFKLDSTTGELISPAAWSAAAQLGTISADDRKIITYDGKTGGVPFRFDKLEDKQKDLLDSNWKQDDTLARSIVDYLRGDPLYEKDNGGNFRNRTWSVTDEIHPNYGEMIPSSKIGDIVHSSPVFKNGVLYAGANDGMLHALDAKTGKEIFAYVPNLVFDQISKLKDANYSHRYFVDLPPTVANINMEGKTTILIGGLGKGGRGYFGLDVSGISPSDNQVPVSETSAASRVMWEFPDKNTPDSVVKKMGYSFSRTQVVKSKVEDLPYIAIFGNGYNSPDGTAALFILNPVTGALIKSIDTQAGPCNGMSTPVAVDGDADGTVDYVYAGDMQGNLWKFNLSSADPDDWDVAYMKQNAPMPLFKTPGQPITTKPDVMYHCAKKGFVVLFGTGRYMDLADVTDNSTQSVYGIWDYGDDEDPSEYVGTFGNGVITETNLAYTTSILSQTVLTTVTVNGVKMRVLTDNLPNWMVTTEGDIGGVCGENNGAGSSCDPNGNGENPDPLRTAGWRYNLSPGERVVSDVMVRDRKLIVVTNIPEGGICDATANSWVMAMNACSGARLTEVQFDTTGNGVVDNQDIIEIDDPDNPGEKIKVVPTAIEYHGRLQAPAILIKGKEEQMYMSSSTGKIEIQTQKAARLGMVYWRMFRP